MTLIELVVSIVIISVGLAGVLTSFFTNISMSGAPVVRDQMSSIAADFLNEVLIKPYTVSANATASVCGRETFNDILDYHGYTSTGICTIDGTPIPALSGYSVSITVTDDNINGVVAKRITVTVNGTADSLQVVGWRTDWAS